MRKLVFPITIVFVSLLVAVFFTTVTAVTLASYEKEGQSDQSVVKEASHIEMSMAAR